MKKLHSNIRRIWKSIYTSLADKERDSRYVFVLIIGSLVFLLTALQALSNGLFDSIERPVFVAINGWSQHFHYALYICTQLGGLAGLVFWVGVAWYLVNRRAAASVGIAGFLAWFFAKAAKAYIHRGRPGDILDSIHLFSGETFGGYGFPSGHSTLSAACATVLYYQVAPKYRKYILFAVLLVGISRIYLGAHFPLDVLGGWGLGAAIGSAIVLIGGVSKKRISSQKLKSYLRKRGYDVAHLSYAKVDARGSRPLFMRDKTGREYFVKVFGKQEHAADWLFKIYRFFRYKNLQAEEPYINSRRNVEMESFSTLWADRAGVRVPRVVDLLQIGSFWVLIQERIDGEPLSDSKRIRTATLIDIWKQVKRLHASRMAHRDLRAANLLLDQKGGAWLIDFGFAEVSAKPERQYMDVAELLVSMSLAVGIKRTLDTALQVMERNKLINTLPYLQRAVFSGATSKQLKSDKELLRELKDKLAARLDVPNDTEVPEADILRINFRKTLNIFLIAMFLYIVIPQFNQFRGTLRSLSELHLAWLPLLIMASVLTYFFTGLVYIFLSDKPLKLIPTTLVQLASSFVSKVIPGGLGNTSMNARYMTKAGMSNAEASAILVAQGLVGFATFIIPLGLFLLFNGEEISDLVSIHISSKLAVLVATTLIIGVAAITYIERLRTKVTGMFTKLVTSLREISTSPRTLALACTASLLVTLSYIVCLYASLKAFNIPLGIAAAILIYASAVIARSAIPTPGGLGPLEIAMVSSMVGLGIAKPEAFSVVVLYRLATYWLPIPFSLWAYRHLDAKKLI